MSSTRTQLDQKAQGWMSFPNQRTTLNQVNYDEFLGT